MTVCSRNQISLRLFAEADIPNKVKWINDVRNNEFLHYDIPLETEKTRGWFLNKDTDSRLDCVIEYNGISVGLIGLLSIDHKNQKAEYYISMGEVEYKHRGIATEASKALIQYAFKELKLHKVYLNVDSRNEAAVKLYEKLGFIREGFFRDDLIHNGKFIDRARYAILSENYNCNV